MAAHHCAAAGAAGVRLTEAMNKHLKKPQNRHSPASKFAPAASPWFVRPSQSRRRSTRAGPSLLKFSAPKTCSRAVFRSLVKRSSYPIRPLACLEDRARRIAVVTRHRTVPGASPATVQRVPRRPRCQQSLHACGVAERRSRHQRRRARGLVLCMERDTQVSKPEIADDQETCPLGTRDTKP